MQVTGMLYGARMLRFVGFPTSEVLGPAASEDEIGALAVGREADIERQILNRILVHHPGRGRVDLHELDCLRG